VLNPPEYSRDFLDAMANVLGRHSDLKPARRIEYPWTQTYQKSMFHSLIRSSSKYAGLTGPAKSDFNAELATYLSGLTSDPVIEYRTCLIQARREDEN
jgi:hypothetical protein